MNIQHPSTQQRKLAQAEQELAQQNFETCIGLCDEVLASDAINTSAHLFRGVASGQLGHLQRAITDLSYVLERQPDQVQAAFFLGQTLRRNGNYEAAIVRLRPLLEQAAFRHRALFEFAMAQNRMGRRAQAIETYLTLLAEQPKQADAAANIADLLERSNRLDEAENWAERALVLASGNTSARLTRARLHRRRGSYPTAMRMLQEVLGRNISPRNRATALNEMAQCYERINRFDDAFHCYAEANAVQKTHDPEAKVDDFGSYGIELIRFLRQWLQEHPVAQWSPTPTEAREAPVFMLGFPRSGTTLLDQALSAHPNIEVIEERELLLDVRRNWIAAGKIDRLHDMTAAEISAARQSYRNALAAARSNKDATLVVDKLPLNSVYVQLIHRLFPEARIIVSLRDPRDVCLSCFFQTFELVGAMPYFLEPASTARYYDAVMGLLGDALETLPLTHHQVRYERLVQDYEAEMRGLVRFLGIEWNDRLLDYRAGQAGQDISTPSYQQVSQPLYTRSIGRWRQYSKHLTPMLDILEPWVHRFGYDSDPT